jgi:hypothetical protein
VFLEGVSIRLYLNEIIPSSAILPFEHYPTISKFIFKAASRAARSTPVCPPDLIIIVMKYILSREITFYTYDLHYYVIGINI